MEVFYAVLGLILASSAFGALAQLVGDLGRDRYVADHDALCIDRLHALLSVCLIPTSLANLRARRRDDTLDNALLAQIPFNASSLDGLSHFRAPAFGGSAAYAKLCAAIDVAIAMTRELAVTRTGSAQVTDYDMLALAWREAVAAAIEFEQLFTATLKPEYLKPHGERSAFLHQLSFVVLEGGWPCVSDEGAVADRAHMERRLSRRASANIAATLISGSALSPATITDVSLGGLRLKSELLLPVGTQVTVAADGVGLLKGRVAWGAQASLGIHLNKDCRAVAKQLYDMALRGCKPAADGSDAVSQVRLGAKVDN